MKKLLLIIAIVFASCSPPPTQFSEEALNDVAYSLNDNKLTIKEIINQNKGKKILIDVWATWCADCIKGMPKVASLQKEFPEVVFLFLSVDKNKNAWKNGIARFNIKGQHYNLPSGMKDGAFVDFLSTSWIPRYLVIDEQGNITLFKATSANDKDIVEALK